MRKDKPYVRNAADSEQVAESVKKARLKRENELADLAKILAIPEGRRVLWRLMSKCKVFGSIWEPSARIHYNSGLQDFGHFIMAEIAEADEESLFTMMRENMKKED